MKMFMVRTMWPLGFFAFSATTEAPTQENKTSQFRLIPDVSFVTSGNYTYPKTQETEADKALVMCVCSLWRSLLRNTLYFLFKFCPEAWVQLFPLSPKQRAHALSRCFGDLFVRSRQNGGYMFSLALTARAQCSCTTVCFCRLCSFWETNNAKFQQLI